MRIAVITDIHGNIEALQACIRHARRIGVDQFALLGDFVGYGAAPAAVVAQAAELSARGAIIVRGNHEEAVLATPEGFTPQARQSADWTRGQLSASDVSFLSGLELVARQDWCLFAHASAHQPERWIYVDSTRTAADCIAAYPEGVRLGVFGHVHRQLLFHRAASEAAAGRFDPVPGAEISLSRARRWAALAGSAGQPRDGNAAAAWLLLDMQRESLTFHRVAYDVDAAAERIRKVGLPGFFAERLAHGT
ncbi:MAG: metallophosphoesterase family protein [Pseudomonadota bacterium]|nr:metallophosphoesterase family protein [Pseudomonadota bacterium]